MSTEVADDRKHAQRAQLLEHLHKLFGLLSDNDRARLAESVGWVTIPAGQWLFGQGDNPDAAYVVLSGRLRVVRRDQHGSEHTVGELGRGELLGEMALLHEATRNASALAVRDTDLAVLPKSVFDELMAERPAAMLHVARSILSRVRGASPRLGPKGSIVAVLAAHPDVDLSGVVAGLAEELSSSSEVLHVSRSLVEGLLGSASVEAEPGHPDAQPLRDWLHRVDDMHELVLLEADPEPSAWTTWAAGQADHVIVIGRSGGVPAPGPVEQAVAPSMASRRPRHTLVLLHPSSADRPTDTRAWLDAREVDSFLHLRSGHRGDLGRLARHVSGTAVGVAFGGGGARGFAHLGTVRACHELGIPIDYCAGASIGAVFAALTALGRTPEDIANEIRRPFARILDYTAPVASMVRGRRMVRATRATFGDRDIADLWIPTSVTTTSLTSARSVAHDRGPAVDLLRASTAIPGVFPPVPLDGELHVDGGVLDNIPVGVVRDRPGVGTVIAVDVAPHRGPRVSERLGLHPSGWRLLANRLVPKRSRTEVPGIMSTVLRSLIVASERERTAIVEDGLANCYLEVDTRGVSLLDFKNLDAVADRGYESARRALQAWIEDVGCPT